MKKPPKRNKLTHLDPKGRARMVDVGEKPVTQREAVAGGTVYMKKPTLGLISSNRVPKGDVIAVARIAGIMAAKKTPEIIPLCHSISLSSVELDFRIDEKESLVAITSKVRATDRTGAEMEALMAVSAAALTVYDMCKAVDREMVIGDIALLEKRGGRTGGWKKK